MASQEASSSSSSSTSPPPPPQEWQPTNWGEEESPKDRLFRKFREQPFVPAGCLLTCAALVVASHHLRKGNRDQLNRALRWRIYFQGITVVAALGGMYYYDKSKKSGDVGDLPAIPQAPPVTSGAGTSASSPSSSSSSTSTLVQDAREQLRQAKSREEWEQRFRAAKEAAAAVTASAAANTATTTQQTSVDDQQEQKRFEEALLRGIKKPGDDAAADYLDPAQMRQREIDEKRRNRPVVGRDGRDRSA